MLETFKFAGPSVEYGHTQVLAAEPSNVLDAEESILEVSHLSVYYRVAEEGPQHPALHDVGFRISPGEVVALVGESGSGKSTLALALMGLLPRDARVASGSILFRGKHILGLGEVELEKMRGNEIALISQEPATALNPVMRVGEQVSEVLRAHRDWDRQTRREAAEEIFGDLRLPKARRVYSAYPHELSGGEQQRVAIGQALACGPVLLIADEPASALDTSTQAEALAFLKRVRAPLNTAFLVITHNPAMLVGWAERALVLHQGELVEETTVDLLVDRTNQLFTRRVMAAVTSYAAVGALISEEPSTASPAGIGQRRTPLFAKSLFKCYSKRGLFMGPRVSPIEALRGVSLVLREGTTTALVGASGAGKSTFARCLAGLEQPDCGEIWLDGFELSRMSSTENLERRRKVQLLVQNTAAAFNPWFSLEEIVAEPLKLRALTPDRARNCVLALMGKVGLQVSWCRRRAEQLSGGQRQRLALARALAAEPRVLILDEALSGLDLPVQAQMIELLLKTQVSASLAYLFITHDLRMAGYIADKVAVMQAGRIVEYGTPLEIFSRPKHECTRCFLDSAPGMTAEERSIPWADT